MQVFCTDKRPFCLAKLRHDPNGIFCCFGQFHLHHFIFVITSYSIHYTKLYDPETKALFSDASPDQHKKLAAAVGAYAANIERLDILGDALDKMAQAHVRTGVKPEHYPMVGVSLLGAVKDVLGDAATDEVLTAWKEAYFYLGDLLIAREKELYAAA